MRHSRTLLTIAGICVLGNALALAAGGTGFGRGFASASRQAEPPLEPRDLVPPLPRYREGGTPYDPNQRLTPYATTIPQTANCPASGVIESPPEYSPARGVIFQYSAGSWPSVVRACVKALTADPNHDDIAYVVVSSQAVANAATSAFVADGADMSKVVFFIEPTDSVWLRDYGPHFIWQDGTLAIVDSHYYPARPLDNFIPTLLGDDKLGVPTFDMGLYYSGGNFQPGPNRSGFATSLINLDNPLGSGFDDQFLRGLYSTFQGIDTLNIMPQLPGTVDGTGHIDMWMYLVDETHVIISEFIPGSNATAISITNNAVPYMESLGFTVYRPKAWVTSGVHYTYTNAFRVNDRIFVPVYGTAIVAGGNAAYNDEDADAMAKWQAAAGPDVQLIPIQCYSIIPAAGAIHCIVMQVPRDVDSMPSAHIESPAAGELWLAGSTETIRWNATDTNNADLSSVDLSYSLDDGTTWIPIANGIPDSGSYDWTVPAGSSAQARIQVVAHAADGDVAVAVSGRYVHKPGTAHVYDFATGAGVDKFGYGRQTGSWSANVSANPAPVSIALSAANYVAMSTSNATGGDTDANRYISPSVTSGYESTHTFEFLVAEDPTQIDEITVLWEGYADQCTQAELYVWNHASNQWGDAVGNVGQNRYLNCFAGNRDGTLIGFFRDDLADYIGGDGSMLFLLYAERGGDETYHDYMSLTVKQLVSCTGDLDGSGAVDAADLAVLLGAWGDCAGCVADLDLNGTVDASDLAIVLGAWGGCP